MKRALLAFLLLAGCAPAAPLTPPATPGDAELAVKKLRLPPGFKAEVVAAEPQLANPVAFCFDEKGRIFASETFRAWSSVYDIRSYMSWLDDDLGCRTVEDREKMYRKRLGADVAKLEVESEQVRLLEDADGDGRMDRSTVFADGFRTMLDGIASGVLAMNDTVWFTNIPSLWKLTDTDGDGKADERTALHTGYGVHMNYIGHDLHGLILGPDGKLYFSIGDRGLRVKTREGKLIDNPDSGAVLRCDFPNGDNLELVHTGLRNPQELAFDQLGNLWTWDNNCDWHDMARWVMVVPGGDSGWRIGYQFFADRGAWERERIWEAKGDAPYRLAPIANIDHGPSGIAFYPGTGLPARYDDHFIVCNFPGGLNAWAVKPKGASYEVVGQQEFVWNIWATDVAFGPKPGVYISDWGDGWMRKGVGRIFRVFDPALENDTSAAEVARILAGGLEKRPAPELAGFLAHRDLRVRQQAQFELARRKDPALAEVALKGTASLARLHGIWGLRQIGRDAEKHVLLALLADADAETRAQAAKALGEVGAPAAALVPLLKDESPRVRFFAAMGLRDREAMGPVIEMLRENADQDQYLRHAGVMALSRMGDADGLMRASKDSSRSVRLASLLAMRKLGLSQVAIFLDDGDPALVVEAARAINDVPIEGAQGEAIGALAGILSNPALPEKALLRAINANFRLGEPGNAEALAAFAARQDVPEGLRVEALRALADWEKPPGRDRVVGVWRPLPPRRLDAVQPVLGTPLEALLRDRSEGIKVQALRTVKALRTPMELNPMMLDRSPAVRIEVVKLFAETDVIRLGLHDKDLGVRVESIRRIPTIAHGRALVPLLDKLAEKDEALAVRQAAIAALASTPGGEPSLRRLEERAVPPTLALDLAEALAKVSGKPLPELPAGALLEGGDPKAGAAVYNKPETQCVRCHRLGDGGGPVGPALTDVGSRLTKEKVLQSLLEPNAEIAKGFEQAVVRKKSGDIVTGRVEREDAGVLVLMDNEAKLVTIAKSDIDARKTGLSAMPEDLGKKLSKRDVRDVVEFLSRYRVVDPKKLPLEPGAIVVDDEDPARFRVEGNWRRVTAGGDYGTRTHWAFPDETGRAKATWTVPLPKPGRWKVYAWYGIDPQGTHATNAPFSVVERFGARMIEVDQTKETCSWKLLGTFSFGASATVTLSSNADNPVYADAVKLVPE
jgi:quinoprotein glucose dehydrogenase